MTRRFRFFYCNECLDYWIVEYDATWRAGDVRADRSRCPRCQDV